MQTEAPGVAAMDPAVHLMQFGVASVAAKLPLSHAKHAILPVMDHVDEPDGHGKQKAALRILA
jgi:hypothetical protein